MVFFSSNDLFADELTMDDADRFHELCNQPFVLQWMIDWKMTLEAAADLLEYFIGGYATCDPQKQPYAIAVRTKDQNQLIGICGFGPKEELGGNIEICYFIDESHSNRGFMTQIIPKAIAYFFNLTQEQFLCALVDDANVPSKKILLRNGFSWFEVSDPKGILKSHYRLYRKE
jgi:[ribosomal protein S5]-alanine N-acetyltransferase